MEHFLEPLLGSREICRVLTPGGHYVALIHVALTPWQSVLQKLSQYVLPRPHPVRLGKWIAAKLSRPIRQPIQNRFTAAEAGACLEQSGFEVRRVITKENDPTAPLVGPHVLIFVCRKPGR
jgi:hypothetical protein